MDLYCTRPGCPKPVNPFADLDDAATLKSVPQKYCTSCGMPLILVGRYLPTKLLGQGGFGAAFLACDRYTPAMRQCVVKLFLPSNTLSPTQLQTAQELFEREAQALDELGNEHPQIPDLFAFFELTVPAWQPNKEDQFFYLVQEYIDGQTMEEELNQHGVFSSAAVIEVLREILTVLQFVHDRGAIHRDIKPTNIMRHRNGLIYLLDFGAVRQVAKGGKSTGIYSEGYAPPEQMNGSEVYPSSDLYALAVTCILLLTGKQPTDLYDAYRNVWRWRNDAPQVNPALADVLDRMLQVTPSERYQSAVDVLQALVTITQSAGAATHQQGSSNAAVPATTLPPAGNPAPLAPPPLRPAIAPFSIPELLLGAGFTGFQGGLLAIALVSLLGTTALSAGFWLILLVGLILAQSRRVIERVDLLLLAGLTLVLVLFIPPLRTAIAPFLGNGLITILVVAGFASLGAIAVTILFRLIYLLARRFLP
ncbi:MAG: serine/threonine-protein kinase [Leptolyngbyaceae cyanobacterium bins.302]|nr:serine/threonine-protein kinase [Leptolyngbyaceae cyanobacterium bins.302]